MFFFFFFKQKTAYEIRPCDWSSDVCSSDLPAGEMLKRSKRSTRTLSRTSVATMSAASRSEERRVGKECRSCVDLGGRRIIKKKKNMIGTFEIENVVMSTIQNTSLVY